MLAIKRVYKFSLLFLIIGLLVGVTIGRSSNGSNLIIDEEKGISNAPWLNATVGVNTPYLEAEKIDIEEFYLNGDPKTDVLNYTDQIVDYIITREDSIYRAKNTSTGIIDYSGTGPAAILQNIVEEGSRSIYLNLATLDLEGNVTFDGSGDSNYPTLMWEVFGRNGRNTTINLANGEYGFIFKDAACVKIHDLRFSIPTGAGNMRPAIFGDDSGSDFHCITYSSFGNIYFTGGEGSTYYQMQLRNPKFWTLYGINRWTVTGGAGGLLIEGTESGNQWGDSSLYGLSSIFLVGNDKIGVCYQNINEDVVLIYWIGRLHIHTEFAYTGTTGIKLNGTRGCRFIDLQIEQCDVAVDLDNCLRPIISGPYISVDDGGTIFNVSEDCEAVNIGPFRISLTSGVSTTILDDGPNIPRTATYIHDIKISGTPSPTWSTVTQTRMFNIQSSTGSSEASDSATMLSGWDNVTVAHGLLTTPNIVLLTGTHSEVSSIWYSSVNATHFTIFASAPVTANRFVKWSATVNQRWGN